MEMERMPKKEITPKNLKTKLRTTSSPKEGSLKEAKKKQRAERVLNLV